MHKQYGSVMLILLIIIALTAMTSVVILQTNTLLKKQINFANLLHHANQLLIQSIETKITNFSTGINLDDLPRSETTSHKIGNQNFTGKHYISSILTTTIPLAGYSLNSRYQTNVFELNTTITGSSVKTAKQHIGLGCLGINGNIISNQVEAFYSLDLDQNTDADITYQFDSANGKIWKIRSGTELLIDFDLNSSQSFSRPDFVVINSGTTSKMAIVFVIQNTSTVSAAANNTLYILFDSSLVTAQVALPLTNTELIDLQTHPVFNTMNAGYFLSLDHGQLISSAITTIDRHIYFATQAAVVNPVSGLNEYANKFITIELKNQTAVIPSIQDISSTDDLLSFQLNTSDNQIISLRSQYGELVTVTGECRRLYEYES